MSLSTPPVVVEAFAVNGLRNVIPVPSQILITPGAASFNDGFPPLTMTPLNSGGIPPDGKDINGILYDISAHTAWLQGGGTYGYDSTFSAANGYAVGATLTSASNIAKRWINYLSNNTHNPDVDSTGWAAAMLGYPLSTAETNAGITSAMVDTSIPWGYITRYGAIADDSTDNTVYIQRAADQCSQGGAAVFVPPALLPYRTGQISMASGLTFCGSGYFSCIKLKNSGNNRILANTNGAVYVDDVQIFGVRFDCNKANNTSGGAYLGNGRRNTIHNCYIHDATNAGIQFGASSNGATNTPLAGGFVCVDNMLRNCGKSNSWGQLAVTHGTGVVIENNFLICDDAQVDYGIDIEANAGNLLVGISVSNNVIVGGNIQIDGQPLGGTNTATGITVVGNYIDARGRYNPTDKTAMAPLWLRQIKDFNISGNVTHGHDTRTFGGLVVENSGITTTYSANTGCFSNNVFRSDVATARTGYCNAITNVAFLGNNWQVNTSVNALEFNNSPQTVRGAGNIINNAGSGYAIRFSTGDDVVFDSSNALTGQVMVTGSTNSRVALADIYGTTAWDIPNTANLGMAMTTVTVTGATRTKGMGVKSCVLTTLPTGWGLSPAITGTGEVTVVATNVSGGASDPPSGTLTVTLSRELVS